MWTVVPVLPGVVVVVVVVVVVSRLHGSFPSSVDGLKRWGPGWELGAADMDFGRGVFSGSLGGAARTTEGMSWCFGWCLLVVCKPTTSVLRIVLLPAAPASDVPLELELQPCVCLESARELSDGNASCTAAACVEAASRSSECEDFCPDIEDRDDAVSWSARRLVEEEDLVNVAPTECLRLFNLALIREARSDAMAAWMDKDGRRSESECELDGRDCLQRHGHRVSRRLDGNPVIKNGRSIRFGKDGNRALAEEMG